MANSEAPCSKQRESLLEIFLDEEEKANLPSGLSRHMEKCDACRRYWDSMKSVRAGYPGEPLYSPFLRAKTLRRLNDRGQAFKRRWVPVVVLGALLSISFSFVLPVWLLAKFFMYWTSSMGMACGAALVVLLLIGTLVTVVSAILLMERGYILSGDEEETLGRAAFPSEAGIR
jgi:hypothetical protein